MKDDLASVADLLVVARRCISRFAARASAFTVCWLAAPRTPELMIKQSTWRSNMNITRTAQHHDYYTFITLLRHAAALLTTNEAEA